MPTSLSGWEIIAGCSSRAWNPAHTIVIREILSEPRRAERLIQTALRDRMGCFRDDVHPATEC